MNKLEPSVRPARRFLHVCYCTADHEPIVKFLIDAFGMKLTMTSTVAWSSGAVLGITRDTLSGAGFVYDARGPRTSPALEVQTWKDPALVGTPPTDATAAGIHAVGVTVPDLASTEKKLVELGCSVVTRGSLDGIGAWLTIRDPWGVTFDVIEGIPVASNPSQLRHLRVSVTDLVETLEWMDGLGFREVGRFNITDGSLFGVDGDVDAVVVRLQLPDEPFEVFAIQWNTPKTHGRHTDVVYSAGLFRAALGVDDVRVAYDALTEAGWEFDRAPITVPLTGTPIPELTVCFLNDPDGIPFEFVERARSQFRP
jgi:catechol 2,3-dioxygenase-like lactoylglutathione lyase family enzyme